MKNRSPIYNLLHQEIKACADHLLEMGQRKELSLEKDAEHILSRLQELHEFASKVRVDEHYQSLSELKEYLENTMLRYQDEQNKLQTMRFSEAITLLNVLSPSELKFKPAIVHSLTGFLVRHFLKEAKPGHPLFRKLTEIQKI